MEENSNKAIAVNTVVLYIRLAITAICSLFATRFVLQALGANDYGIFSVVGGIISFVAIINSIMLSTSNRFLAVEIGKGDLDSINKQFNVNLFVHVCIAVFVLFIAFPVGWFYINHYVNYLGDISNVFTVYNISIIGAVISFIGVPYNGLLVAKEKFVVFCLADIIAAIARLVISYCLIYYFAEKLLVYTITTTILTILPTIIFIIYCTAKFRDIVKIKLVKDKGLYIKVLSFSTWVGVGAIAYVGKAQGSALIVNAFFNTIMNAALGIANSVNTFLMTFANNITKSISPQITKSYARGDIKSAEDLVILSTRLSYLFMLFVSTPFLIVPEFMFQLWLGQVPPYVILFTRLIIIDTLIRSLNSGVLDLVFATGKIKWYQIIESSLLIASVIVGFFLLKLGYDAYYLLLSYVLFSIIVTIVRQIILKRLVKFDVKKLYRRSYIPSIFITLLFLVAVSLLSDLAPSVLLMVSWVVLVVLIAIIGLNKRELVFIVNKINKVFRKQ